MSHEVPKPKDKRHTDEKLDVSSLDDILLVDAEKRICVAEPGATFEKVVDATLKYGLIPVVVPEFKTLLSTNLYSEDEFWKVWNKANFCQVKEMTDPDNIFRGLYEKMCRASRGM